MRRLLFLAGCCIFLLMGYTRMRETSKVYTNRRAYEKTRQKIRFNALRCAPDWSSLSFSAEETENMILLPGTGIHTWKISTASDSAQLYFNQGINLYYGFHIVEAIPSFKKALLFDSTSAILYWALALSYGPNINDMGYIASPDALNAISGAKLHSGNASLKEKELIDAMDVHYSADSTKEKSVLNQLYAGKMKALYLKYPDDAEISTLYADALMNLHPWEYWQKDGRPQPWTPELMEILEKTIAAHPDHPGANHYYIHTMEASPDASKANESADKLGRLAPGLAHMVHMPSHIYIRTGAYAKGRKVNEEAVKDYYQYLKIYPAAVNGAFLYEYHNLHMLAASSINMSDYSVAVKDAMNCRRVFDSSVLSMPAPLGDFAQYAYMLPVFTMITFEKWKDILQEPVIDRSYHYAKLIQEFGRGMAFAHTGKTGNAKSAAVLIDSLLKEKDMSVILPPFNAPVTGGTVAKYILLGTIAETENRMAEAVTCFEEAVAVEDSLIYNEPRDWLVQARHYLGNALLKQKNYTEAKKVFLKDLTYQPNNFISTNGLKIVEAHLR